MKRAYRINKLFKHVAKPLPDFSRAHFMIAALVLIAFFQLHATEIHVTSITALRAAIDGAAPGDTIVLANGTYLNADFSISGSHLTIRPETPGGAFLNGATYVYISGDYNTFSGFQFTSGDIGSGYVIIVVGSHNTITQLNFNGFKAKKYISIADGTSYNEISYCNIENKPVDAVTGCTVQINTSPTVPGYHKIKYCSFRNFPGPGGDFGNEPIRIGLGAESTNISRTVIEYCYFTNTGLGDGENISIKCRENVVRYCTFDNNPKGMLVFRNGDRNIAYGNFFINGAGGIRVKEANDIYCYNNYFETAGGNGQSDAITFDYVSPNLNNINFYHNTFVNCGDIDLGGPGPMNVRFGNNIFKKASGTIFSNPNGQTTWTGNMYLGTPGITIASGMTSADPLLALNPDGYYGLTSASPAIDASSPDYPAILDIPDVDDDPLLMLDISGQNRPAEKILKDVGCDEYTTGVVTNRILKPRDVGPAYLVPNLVRLDEPVGKSFHVFQNYPNPFNPSTHIQFSLSVPSHVKILVSDMLGRQVSVLMDERKNPGTYQVRFNGSHLSSGIYLYSIEANGVVITKSMQFIK